MPNGSSPTAARAAVALVAARQLAERRRLEALTETVDPDAEAARANLAAYLPLVHRTDGGLPAIPPRHLRDIVIPVLQDDSLGHTVIIAPPGSAKTNTSIGAAGWWLGHNQTQHIGFFSNTDRQAYRRSVAVRDTIDLNPAYHRIFPQVQPDRQKGWAEFEWFLRRPDVSDKDASFTAGGVGSPILGARLDRIFFDDIADRENMATAHQRGKVIEWLETTAMTRLTPGGRAIMICTRWGKDDPAAWAIAHGWHVVHIPAVDDEGHSYWPERWSDEDLTPATLNMTLRRFMLMYLGVVRLDETPGALWKQSNLDANRVEELPELARIVVAVDPAVTAGEDSDDTGMMVGGLGYDGHGYVFDDITCHVSPALWGERAVLAYIHYQADRIVGEVNNGGDLVELVIRTAAESQGIANVSYKAVRASRGKVTRAEPVAALYEQNRVHHVGLLRELEDEQCDFVPGALTRSPNRVDAVVWLLTELMLPDEDGRRDEAKAW